MSWSAYGSFPAFAVVLVLVPGPDFAVVTKNTLAGGRRPGLWSAVGVSSSNAVQGIAAAAGLGAVIVRAQPVFHLIKWAGIGYLVILAVLPQFLGPRAGFGALILLALTHAVLSLLYLVVLVGGMQRARRVLTRRRVRRALDAATGTALLGFSARLATE